MGDITLNERDQKRARVLVDLEGDRLTATEAAAALAISTRQLRRLRGRVRSDGLAALIHRNRGRAPVNRCEPGIGEVVVELAKTTYMGFNQVHYAQTLEREEGILLSRSTVRRMLEAEGIGAPKPQRRSRHRRHRVRKAQAGAMVQLDGSKHDWLEGRGPELTLVGGIDDATGRVWGVFRYAEDTEGYLELLAEIVADRGRPCSVYTDRTAIMLGTLHTPERVATGTVNFATQLTRVLDRLDITLIRARSPQAKGRVERLWRTLQDRLLSELRAKEVRTLATAQAILRNHLAVHNRLFERLAFDPSPAWRPLPDGARLDNLICWSYQRTVTNANTVRVEALRLQLELPAASESWARRRVHVFRRLDGTWYATHLGTSVPATLIAAEEPRAAAA